MDDAATKAEKELAAALTAASPVQTDIDKARADIKTAENAMKGSDGDDLDQATYEGTKADKSGLYALDKADLFRIRLKITSRY